MRLRIAISVSKLSAREMESDSDGSNREERPRSAASPRGSTRCREEGCEKVARAGGLCMAHGGECKRCKVSECEAIARGGSMYCKEHTNQAEINDAARNIIAIGNAQSILNGGGTIDHILIP